MNDIRITPELMKQYTAMTKNEILLHMAIRSFASEGKLKRNLNQMGRAVSKHKQRLLDAEDRLQRRGLLRIGWEGEKRWWHIYDAPPGQPSAEVAEAPPVWSAVDVDEPPKHRSLFRRIRDAFVGTTLDNFDLDG